MFQRVSSSAMQPKKIKTSIINIQTHTKINKKVLLSKQSFLTINHPFYSVIPEVFSLRQGKFTSVPIVLHKSYPKFPRGPALFTIISVFVHRRRLLALDMFQSAGTETDCSLARILVNTIPLEYIYSPIPTRQIAGSLVSFARCIAFDSTAVISCLVVAYYAVHAINISVDAVVIVKQQPCDGWSCSSDDTNSNFG
jgi:hypothetical protein